MGRKHTTVIVGSGILGASHAYTFSGTRDVLVFDQADGPAQNLGTGASSACVRRHYSHPDLALLATYGFEFLESLQKENSSGPFFTRTGCLSLAQKNNPYQVIYRETFEKAKICFDELSRSQLIDRYEQLQFEGLESGIYDQNAGYADPHGTTKLLTELAKKHGAQFFYNTAIAEILNTDSKVSGVKTADGKVISCDEVIIAGSYLTEKLLAASAIKCDLPSTSKRPVFTVYVPLEDGKFQGPIFADFSNEIYCKPESEGILVGSIAAEDEEIKIGLESHHHIHDEGRLLSLLERIRRRFRKPIINKESIRIVTGFYDVNDVDWIPVQDQVGPEGLYVSYATSGHGFKLAFPMSELLLSQIDGCPKPRALANIETSIFNLNNKRINAGGVLA